MFPCYLKNPQEQRCPPKVVNNGKKNGESTKMQMAKIIRNGKKTRMKLETNSKVLVCPGNTLGGATINKPAPKPKCMYSEISGKDGKARNRLCCN